MTGDICRTIKWKRREKKRKRANNEGVHRGTTDRAIVSRVYVIYKTAVTESVVRTTGGETGVVH